MSKKERALGLLSLAVAVSAVLALPVNAMHVMEGYLPVGHCVAWGAVCLPFLVFGFIRMKRLLSRNRKNIVLLAVCGAYVFLLSSLKIPSVTGSCSHMTGTGLSAILFGPCISAV